VSLQWDSCPAEDNVSGYVLYYGTKARGYTKAVDIGNTTGANINSLEDGVTYYFAVTAYRYDAAGNREESDYSEELKT
jgi:hypothetical protein